MNAQVFHPVMTVGEAAEYLRLSKATLNRLRVQGDGPSYVQAVPGGRVIYRLPDLDCWLADHTRSSTSDAR